MAYRKSRKSRRGVRRSSYRGRGTRAKARRTRRRSGGVKHTVRIVVEQPSNANPSGMGNVPNRSLQMSKKSVF